MPNGARLWWVQHGSPQGVPQETAACTWPCETSRRCSSSGGIIVDTGSNVGESQQEAESVFSQSLCTTGTGSSSGSASPGVYNAPSSSSGSNGPSYSAASSGNIGAPSSNGNGIGSSNSNPTINFASGGISIGSPAGSPTIGGK